MLRDATSWPCEVLSESLSLPSVDVLPVAPSPFFAKHQEFPNPIVYIPQLVADYSPNMVHVLILLSRPAHLILCYNTSLTMQVYTYKLCNTESVYTVKHSASLDTGWMQSG